MSVRAALRRSGGGLARLCRARGQAPRLGWAAALLSLPVLVYRWFVSPVLGPNCRFAPSCSEYALEALRLHGAWRGTALAVHRILRCHPWGGSGFDPVPPADVTDAPWGRHRRAPADGGARPRSLPFA